MYRHLLRLSVFFISFTYMMAMTNEAINQTAEGASTIVKTDSINLSNKISNPMKHELIKLPYAEDALEPVISKETLALHHGKHHKGYVDTLNGLIEGTEFENMTLGEIVQKSEGKMFNQAGQALNHNLYFTQFGPNAGGKPVGKLAEAIDKEWGSFEKFQEQFLNAATALFGSGWVWLACDANGKLSIESEPNGGNPYRKGLNPLLGVDVWEHAYYLTYQNRRADHVKDIWSIVRWDVVNDRYENPVKY